MSCVVLGGVGVMGGLSFVVVRAMKRAYGSACRMFGRPWSLCALRRSFFGLYTPELLDHLATFVWWYE